MLATQVSQGSTAVVMLREVSCDGGKNGVVVGTED